MAIPAWLSGLRPRGDLARPVATLVAGTGGAQLLVIATSPILTRLYVPADYGAFAVGTSLVSILITVGCLRYEYAIPLPAADRDGANVLALALVTVVALSAATGVVLWLVGAPLLRLLGAAALEPYLPLLAIGQAGGGVVTALTMWAVRTRAFRDIATTRVTQAGALVASQLGLGVVGAGAGGLLLGDVVGRVAGGGRLARAAWRDHAAAFRSVTVAGIRFAAVRYRRFPILSSPSALLSTIGVQAPLLLLVALYGAGPGGRYALAERLCSVPLSLVAGAVGQVYVAEAASLARSDVGGLRALFVRTTRSLAGLSLVPAVAAAVAAPVLMGPVFGADWAEAGLYVALLAPMYWLMFATTATGDTVSVLERQDLHLVREVVRFTTLGGAVGLAAWAGLPAVGAVAALGAAGVLAYAIYGLISWRAVVDHPARAALATSGRRHGGRRAREGDG